MLSLTIEQAMKLFYKEFKNRRLLSVVDYDKWFVFNYKFKTEDKGELSSNPLIGIEKTTGKIIGFNPLVDDAGEYFEAVKNAIILGK